MFINRRHWLQFSALIGSINVTKTLYALPYQKPTNVRDFGAVGDGITDDTQAFKQAFSRGNIITIPNGEYLLTNTITLPKAKSISVRGEGKGVSILVFTEGGIEKEFGDINGEVFTLKDMSIQSKSINASSAIRCFRSDNRMAFENIITIDNVEVGCYGGFHVSNNCFKTAIALEYVRFVTISNCFLWGQSNQFDPTTRTNKAVAGIKIKCHPEIAQFGFNLINNQVTCWDELISAEGWFEGIYATNGEYWNSHIGFNLIRPALSEKTPITGTIKLTNLHCNGALNGIKIQNASTIGIVNCDIQNGVGHGIKGSSNIFISESNRSVIADNTLSNFFDIENNGINIQGCDTINITNNISVNFQNHILVGTCKNTLVANNTTSNPDFRKTTAFSLMANDKSTGYVVNNNFNGAISQGSLLNK